MLRARQTLKPALRQLQRKKKGGRFWHAGQNTDFLRLSGTTPRFTVQAIVCKPALELMGSFLSVTHHGLNTVMPFLHPATSPAWKAIQLSAALLADANDNRWLPLLEDAWTSETSGLAGTMCMSLMGNLFLRCAAPFKEWPWVRGLLVHASATDEDKGRAQCDLWNFAAAPVGWLHGSLPRLLPYTSIPRIR